MHISEGILTGSQGGQCVIVAGWALTAVGTAVGLYKIDDEQIPRVAVLSATFFVISLIHVPIPPTCGHLLLAGLIGLVLGWAAFPAILVALLLQCVFFGFGGLVILGVNTLNMALPAVICHYLFRRAVRHHNESVVFFVGFAAGFTAMLLAATLNVSSLWIAGEPFHEIGILVGALHVPLAVVEGFVTGSVVLLLRKVRPELLNSPLLVKSSEEVIGG